MGTRTVRLDDDVYELVKAHKRDEETFSEAIERLIRPPSLLELAGNLTEEEAGEVREAVRRSREVGIRESREVTERMETRDADQG